MKTTDRIDSLAALQRRKRRVAREIVRSEDRLRDDYVAMTQPVTDLMASVQNHTYAGNLPFDGLYRLAVNVKRVADMIRLGFSIYRDYKETGR